LTHNGYKAKKTLNLQQLANLVEDWDKYDPFQLPFLVLLKNVMGKNDPLISVRNFFLKKRDSVD
jgi:hypothetical protein